MVVGGGGGFAAGAGGGGDSFTELLAFKHSVHLVISLKVILMLKCAPACCSTQNASIFKFKLSAFPHTVTQRRVNKPPIP